MVWKLQRDCSTQFSVCLPQPTGSSIFRAQYLAHMGDAPQTLHDSGEMHTIFYHHLHADEGELVVFVVRGDLFDVNAHTVDACRDYRDHSATVLYFHAQLDRVLTLHRIIPAQRHQAFRGVALVREVLAFFAVHNYSLLGAQVPFNGIAGDWVAAACVTDHEALGAADRYRVVVALLARVTFHFAQQKLCGDGREAVATSDVGQQVFELRKMVL